jgi:hypothetical protein
MLVVTTKEFHAIKKQLFLWVRRIERLWDYRADAR